MHSIRAAADWRPVAAILAVLALAFAVAATIKRPPPDFAALAPIAVVRNEAQRPLWEIRLARAAHQIAIDSRDAMPPPAGRGFQLWLVLPDGARSLGLLPVSGRKVVPEIPAIVDRLAGSGELLVTLEPARGSGSGKPDGPAIFRAAFPLKSHDAG